ncbi:MAG: ROK family transcriptional regulator [Anaerolineae bacterium]
MAQPQPLKGLSAREMAVLAALRREPMTRQQVADMLGLSTSSVSRLIEPMLRRQLLVEVEAKSRGVGRPSAMLQVRPAIAYGVGLDIGAMHSRYVVADFLGNVVAKHLEPTRQFRSNPDFAEYICDLGARAVASVYANRQQILGTVAAVSGIVDSAKGVCLICPNIRGPVDLPVAEILERSLGYPTMLEDPARMQALAESRYGAARGHDDVLYIHIGIGVGSGIFLGGTLLHGAIGTAGEIGHILVGENGPRCNCGSRGCLEAYVSGPALVRKAKEGLDRGIYTSLANVAGRDGSRLTVEAINEAAVAGDKMAFHIVDEAGEKLGIAMASALNLLGCPLVVVGGGLSNLCDPFYQAAERAMRMRALPMVSPQVRIVRSALDTYAAAWGAAAAAVDSALANVPAAEPL